MTDEARQLEQKMDGIRSLKQELMLRFALLGHARALDPAVELMASIKKITKELETAHKKVRKCTIGSPEEETVLERIRELEDRRFQLLSLMNGGKLSDYNSLAPRYR